MGYLKQSWSEAEALALPDGEHHFFDRKSGRLWADKHQLQATLSKALSAFANSGGGHIVLGQANDGTWTGCLSGRAGPRSGSGWSRSSPRWCPTRSKRSASML